MVLKICVLLYVVSLVLIVVNINKFMHIFQQSFYEIDEFLPAIRTTKSLYINGYNLVLLACAVACFYNIYMIVPFTLVSVFTAYKTVSNRAVAKKKFVYTNRVKITYAIIAIIMILIAYGVWTLREQGIIPIALCILSLYRFVAIDLIFIGNFLAKPILKIFNSRYIKQAKKIMEENKKMVTIGITGSYGKTSTKNIVTALLEEKFITVMTPKSFNTTLGVVKTIREQIKPYTEVFVCEMGAARLGEIKEICGIAKPDISVITSIGPQHLTSFKSMDNIVKGKFEIVTNAKMNSTARLNIDNEYINQGIERFGKDKDIISFAVEGKDAKYTVENINMSDKGSVFDVVAPDTRITVETKLLGKHNIANIVCAIAIARELGMTNEEIRRGIRKIKPVEHRLELKNMGGILALDDAFNSNPAGSKAAIETLLMFKDKYKVLVTPGMIELGEKTDELNEKFGEYAADLDYVILVGKVTTKAIEKGLKNKGYENYIVVNDLYEAFAKLQEIQISHENLLALFENDLPDSYIK